MPAGPLALRAREAGVAALDASTLDPQIAQPLLQARATAAAIRAAVEQADQPLDDVVADVDGLVGAMETSARRAQLIATTLAGEDLSALEARIARHAGDSDPDVQALVRELGAQARERRGRTDLLAESMAEAFGDRQNLTDAR